MRNAIFDFENGGSILIHEVHLYASKYGNYLGVL